MPRPRAGCIVMGDELLRAKALFLEAADLEVTERAAWIAKQCGADTELRRRVERLLAWDAVEPGSPGTIGAAPAVADATPGEAPREFGDFRLIEELGRGGMGVVWLAEQKSFRRRVALKLIRLEVGSADVVRRFERERDALAAMNHENIAKVYDAGTAPGGTPYFAMELVDGEPIDQYCARHLPTVEGRIALFRQVCAGVQHAHTKGIVHRDLKPGNILVACPDGRPLAKIIDFGLARSLDAGDHDQALLTRAGMLIGTPEYMAPEQFRGDPGAVDARTDIYALGVVLYQLLTGAPPVSREELMAEGFLGMERIASSREPVRPSSRVVSETEETQARPAGGPRHLSRRLRYDLDWAVLCAMAKDPDRRYPSAADFGADLERSLAGLPLDAARPGRLYRVRSFLRRHASLVAVATLILLLITGGLAVSIEALMRTEDAYAREIAAQEKESLAMNPLLVEDLLRRARAPWPRADNLAENTAAIDTWIADADLVLAREGPRVSSPASGPEVQPAVATMLQNLPTLRRLRAAMQERRNLLAQLWPLWTECQRSLARAPGFESLELRPIPNLLPLGIDLDRNREFGRQVDRLWLFAVGGSGSIPEWLGPEGRPARYGTPGRARITEKTALLLTLVPGGRFWRGAQSVDPEGRNYHNLPTETAEEIPGSRASIPPAEFFVAEPRRGMPVTSVPVSAFFVAKFEVTRAQFDHYAVASNRPLSPALDPREGGRHAARGIDWRDASLFCSWFGLVLPSETRWEYVARAGTSTPFWSGKGKEALARVGWFESNRPELLQPVGVGPTGPAPNPWGLHDVHGGVREWCQDFRADNWADGPDDDRPRTKGIPRRVVRGGCFDRPAWFSLSGARTWYPPGCRLPNLGFRPSRDAR